MEGHEIVMCEAVQGADSKVWWLSCRASSTFS